ncbi:ABC transporter substrate-binding protein [Streptomyces sp. GS7]|uniref:ABC transporter substrate-binding protein n=1 Tax=Streptomyces sp. GS7 TaxID=2692234 RepID=UPI001316F426|nr:iron-siderophore ABC transporter substrate-binding protein [Streptomyces sp. GS7]QHC21354.1 ABC transporter substrate-binding protein [Streptomyces sp. GS7]
MPLRRRAAALSLAAAGALALAGCGSAGPTGGSDHGAGSQSVAQGGKDFGKAAEETAKMGTDAAPGHFPRTVRHAMGTTTLRSAPKRVIVLDVGELDNVVSLGIKPVGYAPTEGDKAIPDYLKKDAGDPESVGTVNGLNLEAVNRLRPDLILGSRLRAEKQYQQLSKIAPTVFSIRPGYTWKQNYLLNAAALDKTSEAEAKLAAYEATARRLGQDIGPKKPTVTMLRYMPQFTRLYAQRSFIGTVLKDVGLPRPENQRADDLATEVGPENIDQADADWIFTGVYGDPGSTKRDTAERNPLWKNLKAVRDGHARNVKDETWYLGLGVTAADGVLDDLRGFLVRH